MKTQISLVIRTVWLGSSLFAWRNFASLFIRYAPSEDYDETVNAQAGRDLSKAYMPEGTFSDVSAQILKTLVQLFEASLA